MKLTPERREQIFLDHEKGDAKALIARRYKCTLEAVDRWIKEGHKPHPNWGDQPRSGRPPVLTSAQRASIKRAGKRDKTSVEITRDVNKHRVQPVDRKTIERALKGGRKPLKYGAIDRGDVLRKPNKEKRLAFCIKHLKANCRRWVFVDAKTFTLYKTKHGYRQLGCAPAKQNAGGRGSGTPWKFAFYAAVTYGKKSKLYFVPPSPEPGTKARQSKQSLTSQDWEAVVPKLMAEVNSWFPTGYGVRIIRDRATPHTSQQAQASMTTHNVPLMEDFPPQSWDINIIENVWGVLNNKLLGKRGNSNDIWRRKIIKAWDEVEQHTINTLVDKVPSRMEEIIKKEGAWIFKKGKKHMA